MDVTRKCLRNITISPLFFTFFYFFEDYAKRQFEAIAIRSNCLLLLYAPPIIRIRCIARFATQAGLVMHCHGEPENTPENEMHAGRSSGGGQWSARMRLLSFTFLRDY
jgi:hypothetical protein